MKRSIKFITAFLLVGGALSAQDYTKFEYIHPGDFRGVYSMGDHIAALTFSEQVPGVQDIYQVTVTDASLKVVRKTNVMAPPNSRLADVIACDSRMILAFTASSQEAMHIVELSHDGEIKNQRTLEEDPLDLTFYSGLSFEANDKNVYVSRHYITYTDEDRRDYVRGTEVFRLASDLRMQRIYNEEVGREEQLYNIAQVLPGASGCALLLEKSVYKKKYFDAKISFVDNTGQQQGEYSLIEEGMVRYPSYLFYQGDNLVFTGNYFTKGWYTSTKSDGVFMAKVAANGKEVMRSIVSWDELKPMLSKDEKSGYIFEGKRKVIFHEILEKDGKFLLIGETYGKSSGVNTAEFLLDADDNSSSRSFTIYDFIVLTADAKGKVESCELVDKTSRNIRVNGYQAYQRSEAMSLMMQRSGYFSYRISDGEEVKFFNLDNDTEKIYAMNWNSGEVTAESETEIVPIIVEEIDPMWEDMKSNSGFLQKLENLDTKMDSLETKLDRAGGKVDDFFTGDDQVFTSRLSGDEGQVFTSSGAVYSFLYDADTYSLYLRKILD